MSRNVPGQSVKRCGSAITGATRSAAKRRSQKPVEILEDVWLEALKHFTGPKWSKMRLVTRQLNSMVQSNVSRLPLAILDSAKIILRERRKTEIKLIVSDSAILPAKKNQWFKDQGMTIDVPAGIQLNNAIISVELKKNRCADLCILGPAQKKKLTSSEKTHPWFFGQEFKTEILFYAEFSPYRNKYSWASFSFFLKLLYDPSTYVKELSMSGLDEKVKEILFADEEERYIRCEAFRLEITRGASAEDICKSVSWMEQNIQTDIIQFPEDIRYSDSYICDAMSNYLLGASWISASQVVKLGRVNYLGDFFKTLIKKFRTIATVQSIFPTILLSGIRPVHDDPLDKVLSGKHITKEKRGKSEEAEYDDEPEYSDSDQESENSEKEDLENKESDQESENSKEIDNSENAESDQESESSEDDSDDSESDDNRIYHGNYGDEGTYTISNGPNRMRIEFVKEYEKPRSPPKFRMMTCARFAYGYDIRVTFEANE